MYRYIEPLPRTAGRHSLVWSPAHLYSVLSPEGGETRSPGCEPVDTPGWANHALAGRRRASYSPLLGKRCVLAVEIRQYAGGNLRTLVPRVMGQTSESLTRKTTGTRGTKQWDEPTFFAELTRRTSEEEARVAKRILDWAKDQGCWIWWGRLDGAMVPPAKGCDLPFPTGREEVCVRVWASMPWAGLQISTIRSGRRLGPPPLRDHLAALGTSCSFFL